MTIAPSTQAFIADITRLKQQYVDQDLVAQEAFWQEIRKYYAPSADFINLENGYYSALPTPLLEAQVTHLKHVNTLSSYYMRRQLPTDLQDLKAQLAAILGAQPNEVAIARNATEAANILIMGYPFAHGDEVVASLQDYPAVLEAIAQRERRDGITKRLVDLRGLPHDADSIVAAYEAAITPRTKLLIVTHLIHWTGQIVPAKAICEMAHRRGVEVMVDSAHAFAQLDFSFADLGCDYWAANLHKWLNAPLTGGILAVKQEKIAKIWPLLGDTTYPFTDIRKLEHFSALPMPIFLTVFDAIAVHHAYGTALKNARLHYLKTYWTDRVAHLPNLTLYTPLAEGQSAAIATFKIAGMGGIETAERLLKEFGVFCAGMDTDIVSGVRVTPHLYNSLADLDRLVAGITTLAKDA